MYIYASLASIVVSLLLLRVFNFNSNLYVNKGIVSVTGVRCFLCLLVAISHSSHILYSRSGEWIFNKDFSLPFGIDNVYITSGKIGVLMFFMISGFLFYRLVYKESMDYFSFFKKRVKRIVPMYWFSFLCIFSISIFIFNLRVDARSMLESLEWLLFVGGNKIGDVSTSIINSGVEWTLKLEWVLYFSIIPLSLCTKGMSDSRKDFLIISSIVFILIIASMIRMYT